MVGIDLTLPELLCSAGGLETDNLIGFSGSLSGFVSGMSRDVRTGRLSCRLSLGPVGCQQLRIYCVRLGILWDAIDYAQPQLIVGTALTTAVALALPDRVSAVT